jgi:methylmalonyl-CoA mutase N-terminal domain/subunit
MGYDSDDQESMGEVGKEGVAIDSVEDMEVLFDQIPLEKVTTSMTINAPAIVLLAMYVAVGRRQGVDIRKLGGTLQNDMFKEFIAQKEWICGPGPHLKLVTDVVEWCTHNLPRWNTISISGYHIREAGATAIQELALTLADGLYYVKDATERGLDVDAFAPRLSFFWDVHNDFLEEIAKFRAARRMWARFMKERFHAKSSKSLLLRTHAQTSGVSLTAQQPYNNVVRVALQAMAAVLGGTQSLHTNSLDETYALPTQEAVTIALRTQQIIAEESGVTNIIDPFAGSYAIEALTDKMEAEALAIIEKIDGYGGMTEAIEDGYPQKLLSESSFCYQKQIESGEKTVVGVNKYVTEEACSIELLKVSAQVEKDQVAKITKLKAERDPSHWQKALEKVEAACRANENTFGPILEAVEAGATVGEISKIFREVWGEYQEPAFF